MYEYLQDLTKGDNSSINSQVKSLQLQTVSTVVLIEDAINISLLYGISGYDASYVPLSQQVGATLLTLDNKTGKSIICYLLRC